MKLVLPSLLFCFSLPAFAQKVVVNHANGNKAFEGEFVYGYASADTRDLYNFDTAADKRRAMVLNMTGARPTMERDVAPQRLYNGKCTFFYDNNKPSLVGTYAHGIKNGTFTYWFYSGEKEGECTWINGMADGKWQWWYKNGKMRLQQSYKAFTLAELDTFYARKQNGSSMNAKGNLVQERGRIQFASNEDMKMLSSGVLRYFTEAENGLCKNAHWDGDVVSYYESGKKCIEMHYEDDIRVNTWYYRNDSGRVLVELTFTNGKVSKVVNNMPPDASRPVGPMSAATLAQRDSMMKATLANRKAYPMPDKQPKAAVDLNKYLRENASMSPEAVKNNVNGMVVVTFTVNEDGTTSDHKIMKGVGYGCDEQAIKLVQTLPPWTPGETAGKPVKSTYTVTVPYFKSQLKK